jgi:hypothetical protein
MRRGNRKLLCPYGVNILKLGCGFFIFFDAKC